MRAICLPALLLGCCLLWGGCTWFASNGNVTVVGNSDSLTVVTGVWDGFSFNAGQTITATLAASSSSSTVTGTWGDNQSRSGTFSGQIDGTVLSGTFLSTSGNVNISGTISGATLSGSWSTNSGQTGTFIAIRR